MKYKVRDQFTIKQGREFFTGGDVVELNDAEAADWAHAIEPAEAPKRAAKKTAEQEAAE